MRRNFHEFAGSGPFGLSPDEERVLPVSRPWKSNGFPPRFTLGHWYLASPAHSRAPAKSFLFLFLILILILIV